MLTRSVVIVVETTSSLLISRALVADTVPEWSGSFQLTTRVDRRIYQARLVLAYSFTITLRIFLLAALETTSIPTFPSI